MGEPPGSKAVCSVTDRNSHNGSRPWHGQRWTLGAVWLLVNIMLYYNLAKQIEYSKLQLQIAKQLDEEYLPLV